MAPGPIRWALVLWNGKLESGTILNLLTVVIVVPRSLAGTQTGRPGTPDSLP